jgi:hypothetical protein
VLQNGMGVTLTPAGGNRDYAVEAGVDANRDGILDAFESTHKVDVHVVGVELELNDTPEENDDVVRLSTPQYGSEIERSDPTLNGRLRLVNGEDLPEDPAVTIDNPEGTLHFAAAGGAAIPSSPTTTATLPKGGSWTSFRVRGVGASASKGDTWVRVTADVLGLAGGLVVGQKGMTVFWFTAASIKVVRDGHYKPQAVGNMIRYTVDTAANPNAKAVTMEAEATVRPANLDGRIPQLANLRIGIMQGKTQTNREIRYHNPAVGQVAARGQATVPEEVIFTGTPARMPLNDAGDPAALPLYMRPGVAPNDPAWGADALKPPFGMANVAGGVAKAYDVPSSEASPKLTVQAKDDTTGNVLGTVVYDLKHIKFDEKFITWCVAVELQADNSVKVIAPLRETGWSLDVISTAADPRTQLASPNADSNGGSVPTGHIPLAGPTFNQESDRAGFWVRTESVAKKTLQFTP